MPSMPSPVQLSRFKPLISSKHLLDIEGITTEGIVTSHCNRRYGHGAHHRRSHLTAVVGATIAATVLANSGNTITVTTCKSAAGTGMAGNIIAGTSQQAQSGQAQFLQAHEIKKPSRLAALGDSHYLQVGLPSQIDDQFITQNDDFIMATVTTSTTWRLERTLTTSLMCHTDLKRHHYFLAK